MTKIKTLLNRLLTLSEDLEMANREHQHNEAYTTYWAHRNELEAYVTGLEERNDQLQDRINTMLETWTPPQEFKLSVRTGPATWDTIQSKPTGERDFPRSGPCPKCGGDDRFEIYLRNSKPFGHCRQCNFESYLN
jgi:hypothetical protein